MYMESSQYVHHPRFFSSSRQLVRLFCVPCLYLFAWSPGQHGENQAGECSGKKEGSVVTSRHCASPSLLPVAREGLSRADSGALVHTHPRPSPVAGSTILPPDQKGSGSAPHWANS